MVTHDDIQLQQFPPESCCNCGFLAKSTSDAGGENYRTYEPVSRGERAVEFREHWEVLRASRVAFPQCWMRMGFLENEAGAMGKPIHEATPEVVRKDRSEASDDYCPQYTPWVPHLSFKEHWEERKVYLLERDRRRWEASQEEQRKAWESTLEDSRQKSEHGWNRRFIWLGLVGLVLALAQVVATVCEPGRVIINLQ